MAVGSLPWLIPSLLHPVYVDPASVAAFAARADTPFGSIGSLLMLGGAWNAQTVPKAYGGPWSALWLAVVIVAVAAYLLFAARRPRWPGRLAAPRWPGRLRWPGRPRWPGLGVAAVAGLVIAALGVTAVGRDLLRSLIGAWPGLGVLRDAQQFVAPLALAEAVGFGLAVAVALNPASVALNPGLLARAGPDALSAVGGGLLGLLRSRERHPERVDESSVDQLTEACLRLLGVPDFEAARLVASCLPPVGAVSR